MPHRIEARPPRERVAAPGIDQSAEALAGRLEDAAHFPGGHAAGVSRPRSESEVSALLSSASSVLPIGAQSSVTGGATPAGSVLLSTDRLTSIERISPEIYRVGAGVPLDVLQARLSADGCWYAPAPTFTGAFMGGVIATNAAGAATFKYGTTRPWIDGLTVVLPCGDVLDLERGAVRADPRDGFELTCAHGVRRFRPGRYVMPRVPKCSAGYHAVEEMDLIDLFIGAEGTLGVIVDALVRVLPARGATASALIPCPSEASGLALVHALRDASQRTWAACDPAGIDVAAIEHLDRRCLEVLREDGVDRAQSIAIPPATALLLLVQLELPAGTTGAAVYDEVANALEDDAPDRPITRFCRMLAGHGVLEPTELAAPGDTRRAQQFLMLREGAPVGVNRRVGDARRRIDDRIDKTAADMIVPFDRFDDMMAMYRDGYTRRGLDYAIWGHISDGNVHPNVIPRSYADVAAGREAILEFGREVVAMGGSPLAEHGVGRSSLKQALLRLMYGDEGIQEMRAIKAALDPEWKLAPGVLFARE